MCEMVEKRTIELEDVEGIYDNLPISKLNHIKSVYEFGMYLANIYLDNELDKKIVKYSILLHDIGYSRIFDKEGNKIMEDKHEEYSVEMAKPLLDKTDLDEKSKSLVLQTIGSHSNKDKCNTIYSKILWDSDKIDKTSFEGIVRKVFVFVKGFKMETYDEINEAIINKLNTLEFFFDETKEEFEKNIKYINKNGI